MKDSRFLDTLERKGEVFNLGTGKPTSVNDLAQAVLDLTGAAVGVRYEPVRLGDINESYADITKATRLLGFQPKVPLREGLKALI